MRGGSRSFLVHASNGADYVAKFAKNPEGNRSLINECIANHLLRALGVVTPDLAILRLGVSCAGREQLYFSTDSELPIASGLHLGSEVPADPNKAAIFDLLPRSFFARVLNLDDVGVVFTFDQWTAHLDRRQFIFVQRPRPRHDGVSKRGPHSTQTEPSRFTAWAIDNGRCFGRDWGSTPTLPCTSHLSADIYSHCNLQYTSYRGVALIQSLPSSMFHATTYLTIPNDWFSPGDERELQVMLSELNDRRAGLKAAIRDLVEAGRSCPTPQE